MVDHNRKKDAEQRNEIDLDGTPTTTTGQKEDMAIFNMNTQHVPPNHDMDRLDPNQFYAGVPASVWTFLNGPPGRPPNSIVFPLFNNGNHAIFGDQNLQELPAAFGHTYGHLGGHGFGPLWSFISSPRVGEMSPMEHVEPTVTMLSNATPPATAATIVNTTSGVFIDNAHHLPFGGSHSQQPATLPNPNVEAASLQFGYFLLSPPGVPEQGEIKRVQLATKMDNSWMTVTDAMELGLDPQIFPAMKWRDSMTTSGLVTVKKYVVLEVVANSKTTFHQGTDPIKLFIGVVELPHDTLDQKYGNIAFGKKAISKLKAGGLSRASSPGSSTSDMKESMDVGHGSCVMAAGDLVGATTQHLVPPHSAFYDDGSTSFGSQAELSHLSNDTAMTSVLSAAGLAACPPNYRGDLDDCEWGGFREPAHPWFH